MCSQQTGGFYSLLSCRKTSRWMHIPYHLQVQAGRDVRSSNGLLVGLLPGCRPLITMLMLRWVWMMWSLFQDWRLSFLSFDHGRMMMSNRSDIEYSQVLDRIAKKEINQTILGCRYTKQVKVGMRGWRCWILDYIRLVYLFIFSWTSLIMVLVSESDILDRYSNTMNRVIKNRKTPNLCNSWR